MNAVIILGTMVFFGVVHSLTAGPGFKGWAQRTMGERIYQGTYRLLYNVFSVVTFAPVLAAMALTAAQPLYRVPLPWAASKYCEQHINLNRIEPLHRISNHNQPKS